MTSRWPAMAASLMQVRPLAVSYPTRPPFCASTTSASFAPAEHALMREVSPFLFSRSMCAPCSTSSSTVSTCAR
eukprot:2091447-Pyramimonas_sp.AAC.1